MNDNDRYIFIWHLGDFGFGRIELWYDQVLQRNVVRKTLIDRSYENCKRLIQEGEAYMALSKDQHIVDLLAYRFDYTDPCLILPFYETNLQSWIGRTNWYDTLLVMKHGALGLQSVRSLGADHRDIKPSNMYAIKDKEGKWLIKLGDLGVARMPRRILDNNLTYNAFGTFGYKAWELYLPGAKFTPECDICSLGITGIELITGKKDRAAIEKAWIDKDAKQLLLDMTSFVPSQRPSIEQIVSRADSIRQAYDKNFRTGVVTLGALALALLFGGGGDD